jgi:probable DNA repair protein
LLEITKEILDHLSAAGTLVVPTPQRAAALRLAYGAAQIKAGRRVWHSPDVLPWGAWLERGLDEARARAVSVPRRLSRAQEWLLWREAVRAACADLPVLRPDALIEGVRRAVLLLEDYALVLHEAADPESAVLLRARAYFQQRCTALHALWSGSWSACVPYVRPATPILVTGFAPLAPARRSWLERIGVRIGESHDSGDASGRLQVRDFDNPELEAEAAAEWCAGQLERNPGARMLLVVLRLGEHRHRWLRALSQRLDYRSLLEPSATTARSALVIEGGQPLRDFALIAAAMHLLALATGEADFPMLSALLRSPFLDLPGRESRLRIDLWLREHNIDSARLSLLQTLLAPIEHDLGDVDALALAALIAALGSDVPAAAPAPAVASPAHWAQRFAQVLAHCGWPGSGLNSDEQQVRARFDALLGEFADISMAPSVLGPAQALQMLRQLTARTAFEPASDDVPVTVTASLDDPIVRYDAIWVAGMTAEAWPQGAHPDPLIPWGLQQAAGMPMASPAGMLQSAEEALRHWRLASGELALSWSRSDGDMPHDPSPLLAETALAGPAAAEQPATAIFQLESWLAASAPRLEEWHDLSGPPWPRERALRGGTRLLELQSLCPFRSFASLRLRAAPLPEPAPGIDARVRGQVLHCALELFWSATANLAQLRARPDAATLDLVSSCVERALAMAAGHALLCVEPSVVRREGERAVQLLLALLEWERSREPFEIAQLEWSQSYSVDGASLQLRLDRVDRLADGQLLVIDYKTGAPNSFDALAERPMLPQLPAYAVVAGEQTAAVLSLYLGREGPKLRGIADKPGRLPGLPTLKAGEAQWPALLQRWRQQLHGLVQEFLSGYAAVQPQPGACDSCHLQSFCRIQLSPVPP